MRTSYLVWATDLVRLLVERQSHALFQSGVETLSEQVVVDRDVSDLPHHTLAEFIHALILGFVPRLFEHVAGPHATHFLSDVACGPHMRCDDDDQRQHLGTHLAHPVSYTHLRAHETPEHIVCRL